MLRLKLEFGKKCEGYGYGDITITTKVEDKYDNDIIFSEVLKRLNIETDLDLTDAEGESEEENNGTITYVRSIAYDFHYGLVVETQKEIRQAFNKVKASLNKIKNGGRLRG